jgi:hypothetical protein
MIQKVEKIYNDKDKSKFINIYLVTYTDSSTLNVPLDIGNRHYQEILEWVAAGNTITDSGA